MTNLANTVLRPFVTLGLARHLPVVVTLLLVVLLAQSLAVLTWKILPSPEIAPIVVASQGESSIRPSVRESQVHQISQWHLFGDAARQAPVVVQQEEAPDTSLNLKLRGVLASKNIDLASAIIADQRNQEDAYFVDDPLPGDAILREIYSDRVILEYRGRLETLRLEEDEVTAPRRPGIAKARTPTRNITSARETSVSATASPSVLLGQYREALINDPQSLMDLVRAAPVEDGNTGQLKGFRISPGKDRRLLARFGLRNGDVVTAVNGVPLDNPIKALEIMQQLTTADAVNLQIERRGKPMSMDFQIDD